MSVPADHPLPTYTARVAAISTILSKHLPLDGLVRNNQLANPLAPYPSLTAAWGPDASAPATLTLSLHPVDDFAEEVELLRSTAGDVGYEVPCREPGTYALVQKDPAAVWAVAVGCEVRLSHNGMDPATLVEPALDVAISVGWTDFVDDTR
ncbi:hypothetical protein [Mycolicibacterium brisbanense]|uniref:Uncharacterized protein n=1 Tax=Mycolicibacterium brisbanense TaxID=146020 RepID=A0A117I6K2_9MYCO|nr:hypothetical protein [Mycolicibacterium brisbanense]MCV7157602.1 hypothetical protein [Mycolicibacterium brisbanense]GAS90243.1 uncharacterized protein RMCB_4339 [Mycolicibacterium brisbanense]